MNFRTLQYFIDIADAGSISAAAQKNYITQQSMSKQLKNIEDYYGKTLFKRSSPLKLTKEGRLVYDAALKIIETQNSLLDDLNPDDTSHTITIGNVYSEAPPFLADLLSKFSESTGGKCSLKVVQNCLTDLDVSCDLIFSTEYNSNGYKKIKLLDDRLVCVVSKKLIKKIYGKYSKEKLEELKTANPLDALRELPFVALSSSATNLLYADNSISHMFSEKKIQIITRTNSIGYVNSLCRSGQQACIVNEHHFKHSGEYDSDILILPIKELPKIVMYLYYLRESSLNPYVKKFIETAKNYFKT